jgi:hypothetical protein
MLVPLLRGPAPSDRWSLVSGHQARDAGCVPKPIQFFTPSSVPSAWGSRRFHGLRTGGITPKTGGGKGARGLGWRELAPREPGFADGRMPKRQNSRNSRCRDAPKRSGGRSLAAVAGTIGFHSRGSLRPARQASGGGQGLLPGIPEHADRRRREAPGGWSVGGFQDRFGQDSGGRATPGLGGRVGRAGRGFWLANNLVRYRADRAMRSALWDLRSGGTHASFASPAPVRRSGTTRVWTAGSQCSPSRGPESHNDGSRMDQMLTMFTTRNPILLRDSRWLSVSTNHHHSHKGIKVVV